MHLKYLVGEDENEFESCVTGSYNISKNGYSNLENLMLIEGGSVIEDFRQHHRYVLGFEETVALDEFQEQHLE